MEDGGVLCRNSVAFRCGIHRAQGVLLQCGKHSGAVKIVAQLPGGDGLGALRGEVGKPPPASLDSHALLQK